MSTKKSKAVDVRRDTAENWLKAKNYKPSFGTIIIYDFDDGSVRVKLGDGISTVNDLPFLSYSHVEDSSLVL